MGLLKNDGRLIKSNGKLIKILSEENQNPTEEAPGLYDDDGNLVKTWNELVAEGLVTVE